MAVFLRAEGNQRQPREQESMDVPTDIYAQQDIETPTLVAAIMLYGATVTSSTQHPTTSIAPAIDSSATLDWNTFSAHQWYGFSAQQWSSFEWFGVAAYMLALIAQDYFAAGAIARAIADLPETATHATTTTSTQSPPIEDIQ